MEQAIELIERFLRQHETSLQLRAGESLTGAGFYAELYNEDKLCLGASSRGARTLQGALMALCQEIEGEGERLERLRRVRVSKLTKAHRIKLARGDYDHHNGL